MAADTAGFAREAKTKELRDALAAGIAPAGVPGWEFYFIPSAGPLAGQPIVRKFTTAEGKGSLEVCRRVCLGKYGSFTHIMAGRSLSGGESFGEWDA